MKCLVPKGIRIYILLTMVLTLFPLGACAPKPAAPAQSQNKEPDVSGFVTAVEEEPDTVDFQCTSIHYTVAQNVFNRLVEMESNSHGGAVVYPSLAKEWEISSDGMTYTFHLRDDVTFSNGNKLTSSDVLYTLKRLLTHPDSCNRDIADEILGAEKLSNGEAEELEGFQTISDYDFAITLKQPFAAFLACLSMPGASILDEDSVKEAGDRFGKDPEWTIGTGSFILWKWTAGEGMLLKANPDCWLGAPNCEGLDLRFITGVEEKKAMFESGELDLLNLDEMGSYVDYFMNNEAYKDRLVRVRPISITYIALNESVEPLNHTEVRKALQLALDRQKLLEVANDDRGTVENGIFPRGLSGYNENLPEIPCDPEEAKKLLEEAGYADGFDLTIDVKASASEREKAMLETAASMWREIGVNVTVKELEDGEWMTLRKSGQIPCYSASWTADFNDPDNFIYTFFGSKENTVFRSLCYPDTEIMDRVRKARTITDSDARIAEYRDLEKIIVQDDAAWIPLFSGLRYYVTAEGVDGVRSSWNGSVKNNYRYITKKTAK